MAKGAHISDLAEGLRNREWRAIPRVQLPEIGLAAVHDTLHDRVGTFRGVWRSCIEDSAG